VPNQNEKITSISEECTTSFRIKVSNFYLLNMIQEKPQGTGLLSQDLNSGE